VNEPNQTVVHSGGIFATDHASALSFKHGSRTLMAEGTSGPPKIEARVAEGSPMQRGGSNLRPPEIKPSGHSQFERRVAEGRPVQHLGKQSDVVGKPVAGGQLIGGPVRRA
jgi:hypothetical protein